jgi:cellulose synthase/poly-beta-1,6-N-acetylglucosamine synthase-like glycosyltransferase
MRRPQWGSERRRAPLPTVHPIPSDRQITWARLAIIVTVLAWLAYVISTIVREFIDTRSDFGFTMQAISYVVVVTFLTFSALMYLLARLGALERFRDHLRVPRAELDRHFDDNQAAVTVLVPCYAEEPDVVRKTLWSAALQEYPALRIVLLLDDPPDPVDRAAASRLERNRQLGAEITAALSAPAERFRRAAARFERSAGRVGAPEVRALAAEYRHAADWLKEMSAGEPTDDHVDRFFVEQVLGGLESDLRVTGDAIALAGEAGEFPDPDRMTELHRRLAWTFDAEVSTFERKRYSSLSHEANKAMNLNAYIGLMGGAYREEETPDGLVLRPVADSHPDRVQQGDLVVPDAGYLLTLDADSLLLREYCLRLVHLLEQPENSRVAVTQTPYSAFRGAGTRIERLAGATTDLQHMLHQGSTRYSGTFWVGANAVIRKSALDDIVETEQRGGFEVRRYVQDRTVIEDTESSIDLASHGWTLVNYPERLSYSATPPDFGSLVVQRRRWANGGLLILPKLWRQIAARRRARQPIRLLEVLLRINYMASIAWASIGLLFLLAFPYDSRLLSPFVLLAALPYFLAMQGDLHSMGYKRTDIFRIYGFNLILLPVQLAGVLKSIGQAISGKKIPFARTPKVRNRTAAPALFVIAPYLIIAFSVLTMVRDLTQQNWGNAAFAALNAVLASLAVVSYIGLWHSVVDIVVSARSWLFIERRPRVAAPRPPAETLDWRGVLYRGVDAGSGA